MLETLALKSFLFDLVLDAAVAAVAWDDDLFGSLLVQVPGREVPTFQLRRGQVQCTNDASFHFERGHWFC